MRITEFEYSLAPQNIAAEPREVRLGKRDRCRMLVVDRRQKAVTDSWVQELPDYFDPGDVLVLNNSGRMPGVLKGRAENDGQVDLRFAALKSRELAYLSRPCSQGRRHDQGQWTPGFSGGCGSLRPKRHL